MTYSHVFNCLPHSKNCSYLFNHMFNWDGIWIKMIVHCLQQTFLPVKARLLHTNTMKVPSAMPLFLLSLRPSWKKDLGIWHGLWAIIKLTEPILFWHIIHYNPITISLLQIVHKLAKFAYWEESITHVAEQSIQDWEMLPWRNRTKHLRCTSHFNTHYL